MIAPDYWAVQATLLIRLRDQDAAAPNSPPLVLAARYPLMIGLYRAHVASFFANFLPQPCGEDDICLFLGSQWVDPSTPVAVVLGLSQEQGEGAFIKLEAGFRAEQDKIDLLSVFKHALKQSFCLRFKFAGAKALLANVTSEAYARMYRQAQRGDPDLLGKDSFGLISSFKRCDKGPQSIPVRLHMICGQFRQFNLLCSDQTLEACIERLGFRPWGRGDSPSLWQLMGKMTTNELNQGGLYSMDGFFHFLCKGQ